PDSPTLAPGSGWGLGDELLDAWRFQPDDAIRVDTYLHEHGVQGDPRVIDLDAERARDGARAELGTVIGGQTQLHTDLRVPLRSRGVLVGALDILRGGSSPVFTDAEVSLGLEIAERCALAIDNALLLDAERAAREDLVKFKALADASTNLIAIN